MLFGKQICSSLRQAQCLPSVQRGVWNEKWEADGGNQDNARSESWGRIDGRLPWGCLLWNKRWALSSDEEMAEIWQDCEQQKCWSHCEMIVSGIDCVGQDTEGLRRACNLLTVCWKAVFWTHIYPATGSNPPLKCIPLLSVEGSAHSPLTCRSQTNWDLHKTDRIDISSSRTQI